ncbi:hypothetical protein BJ912DRAFT_1126980 [Pholiota molesta]|nr:hypothetical protein BJ912DRAFT_1126980 [Pholiota molesta]
MAYYYVHGANRMAPLDTEAGQLSAITTMTLMQMVADTYEEARIDWEKNADREMVEGVDDPELFGPVNEAQLRVEGWLVHAQFLPPRKRYKSESKRDQDRSNDLQTPALVPKAMVQKKTSKILQARRVFPQKMLNLIKIKDLLSLANIKCWQRLRTRSFSKVVSTPPSIPAVETQPAPTPASETPKPSDTFSNTRSESARPYVRRPRFPTRTRSRTLELEIERPVDTDDIRPALPRRSATLPFFHQINACHSGVEPNPDLAKQRMYRTAKAPRETERREIITSKHHGISAFEPQHEITVWTLLVITMLGSLSLLTFMSDGAASDI